MCYLCVEWEKGSLSNREAIKAISELVLTEENKETRLHLFGALNKIMDREDDAVDYANTDYLEDLEEDDSECQ